MRRVGIVGGGQLAQMMALAGLPLGVRLHCLEAAPQAPAFLCAEAIVAPWDAPEAWGKLAADCEVISYEVEHAPLDALRWLAARRPVRPGLRALEIAGDRLREKEFLNAQGIATAPFSSVDGPGDAEAAIAAVGSSGILKTRTHGYDGRGQRKVDGVESLRRAAKELACPCIYEGWVSFERELSLVGVRGLNGETRFWSLTENEHHQGILWRSTSPAAPELQGKAEDMLRALFEALDYVGVLCIELFETEAGLVANELAPRVHNSGHWTIEGAETSQFENHLRAILGLPLGSTASRGISRMRNCIGTMPEAAGVLAAGGHLHDYGKSPRPRRKLGHVTFNGESLDELDAREVTLGPRSFG